MIRTHLRREEGTALITAVILVGVMAMLGLAVHAAADTQSRQSGDTRVKESAFTVTEAALDAQVFQVAAAFPGTAAKAFASSCTLATGASAGCPDAPNFDGYAGGDYAATCNGAAVERFRTTVRDNVILNPGTPSATPDPYYSTATISARPSWDANADGIVWVRADGRAGCRTRSLVTQVRTAEVSIAFPRNVVTANSFGTSNKGNKVIVDTNGMEGATVDAADVSLRCDGFPAGPPATTGCADYEVGKGQISPDTLRAPQSSQSPLIDDTAIETIKALARRNGTFYGAGQCPPTLSGEVVYVESMVGCGHDGDVNSLDSMGFLVINQGSIQFKGNDVFYGTLYMRNRGTPPSTGIVVDIQGTAAIHGAVAVDGMGRVNAGSSKMNIVYDSRAASLVKGLGSAAAVPNTWRELSAGQ